jgi:polyhydroxybutyrate depolymerase
VLLLLGLALGGGADGLEAAPAAAAAAPAPLERMLTVDGVERAYLIHVPAAWDRRAPIALLFVFHGAGADAESMVRATGFEAWAEAEPTLIVYPRARRATKRFDVDGTRAKPGVDVRFVDVLLERLKARFPLDLTRICATGFSNGGAFCYRLAADRSTTFAAIAPVGGYLPASVTEGPEVPVPTLHVHGADDRRVPPPLPVPLTDERLPDEFLGRLTWVTMNTGPQRVLVTTAPFVVEGASRGQFVDFVEAPGRPVVRYLLLLGEGHVWSGGPGGAVSREIWTFLRANPRTPPPAQAPVGAAAPAPSGATAPTR